MLDFRKTEKGGSPKVLRNPHVICVTRSHHPDISQAQTEANVFLVVWKNLSSKHIFFLGNLSFS